MEEILGIIFIVFFMEIIFWGIAYATGCLLTPIISFGKWYPDSLIKDEETGKVIKGQSGFKLIERSGKLFLGAWSVSFLGFCFWIITILVIIFI